MVGVWQQLAQQVNATNSVKASGLDPAFNSHPRTLHLCLLWQRLLLGLKVRNKSTSPGVHAGGIRQAGAVYHELSSYAGVWKWQATPHVDIAKRAWARRLRQQTHTGCVQRRL